MRSLCFVWFSNVPETCIGWAINKFLPQSSHQNRATPDFETLLRCIHFIESRINLITCSSDLISGPSINDDGCVFRGPGAGRLNQRRGPLTRSGLSISQSTNHQQSSLFFPQQKPNAMGKSRLKVESISSTTSLTQVKRGTDVQKTWLKQSSPRMSIFFSVDRRVSSSNLFQVFL